jgi:NADH-quinone oxidoreductase subunit H
MAGWASFNKYSLLGGLRSAAQIISYEIPLTLSVVGIILLAGTLSLNQITLDQSGSLFDWYVFKQPLAFIVFFIAASAEANRTPFDLTEADSEIVAGFATEYSGMRFGFFFFAEYVNVFIISGLTAALFFGGWNAPFAWPAAWAITPALDPAGMGIGLLLALAIIPPVGILALGLPFYLLNTGLKFWHALVIGFVLFNLVAVAAVIGLAFVSLDWVVGLVWFMLKTYVFVFTFVWMRGTLPRVRIDQLMGFAWKWLLPASLLNLFVTALAIVVLDSVR